MRRETVMGIAIEILGNGIGAGLQITGFVEPIIGWIIIGISSAVGLLLIGYGIGKGQDDSQQPKEKQSPTTLAIEQQDGSIDSITQRDMLFIISQLSIPMKWRHGHSDTEGLIADRASSVPLNELMARNCSQCSLPRNQKGEDIYADE